MFGAIAAWSAGELPAGAVLAVLENAGKDLLGHREGFGEVVDGLSEEQRERCQPLIDFAFSLLDLMDQELAEAAQGLAEGNRARVIRAGDLMSRASFQMNQTFVEFSHQALRALGPTDIPNLNHLLRLRREFECAPGPQTARVLWEALDAERVLATRSLHDLRREPDLSEVATLKRAFSQHLETATSLAGKLRQGASPSDLSEFARLEKTFKEISTLYPLVTMKLRGEGETRYPDLNLLLKMIEDLEQGRLGDTPVTEALEAVEQSFAATEKKCEMALQAERSVLIAEEIKATLESFQVFQQGVDAVYRFLEERELAWLEQGRALLRDFGSRFLAHQQRLETLREQQNKVLCPYCSHFNEQGNQRCQRCAKPLPLNLGLPQGSTFSFRERGRDLPEEGLLVTENLVPVYEAVRGIREGTLDEESFLAVLAEFESGIESGLDRVPDQADEQEADSQVEDLYHTLDEGVGELYAALEQLRQYPESRQDDHLLEGVRLLDAGSKKIAAAGEQARSR